MRNLNWTEISWGFWGYLQVMGKIDNLVETLHDLI